jgi:hypothetical protein
MKVLVVEDGFEYLDCLARFLPAIAWERAGTGPAALAALAAGGFDAAFLDMRFDRAPEAELLGDVAAVAERFNGDLVAARQFLVDHQGTFVLAAIREAGHRLPIVLSYDFGDEPKRFERLAARHGPLHYVVDTASPDEIGRLFERITG